MLQLHAAALHAAYAQAPHTHVHYHNFLMPHHHTYTDGHELLFIELLQLLPC